MKPSIPQQEPAPRLDLRTPIDLELLDAVQQRVEAVIYERLLSERMRRNAAFDRLRAVAFLTRNVGWVNTVPGGLLIVSLVPGGWHPAPWRLKAAGFILLWIAFSWTLQLGRQAILRWRDRPRAPYWRWCARTQSQGMLRHARAAVRPSSGRAACMAGGSTMRPLPSCLRASIRHRPTGSYCTATHLGLAPTSTLLESGASSRRAPRTAAWAVLSRFGQSTSGARRARTRRGASFGRGGAPALRPAADQQPCERRRLRHGSPVN
jgi:hypothetical protein